MEEEVEGPDRVLLCDYWVTHLAEGTVKLRKIPGYPGDKEPMSLITYIKKQCQDAGDRTALTVKRDGTFVKWSYNNYLKDIESVAKAFISIGALPHHGVAIWGFNSPEWFISDIAAIFVGGMAVGLYPTNSESVNKFILRDCRANVIVVEEENQAKKILNMKNDLPDLKKIVQWSGVTVSHPDVISWTDLLDLGQAEADDLLVDRHRRMAINQCAMIVYTSGTTGNPKGVMLSHDNIYWMSTVAAEQIRMREFTEVMVSYLPLSHVAANMVDIWSSITCKGSIFFADKLAMKGTLVTTLKEARPTIFLGVPRVWEKMMEGMQDKGKSLSGLAKKVSESCTKAALQHHIDGKDSAMYSIGKKIVFKKVLEALGLDRCGTFFSGAAPISTDTLKFFLGLDIVILELYGLSETNGPQTMSYYGGSYRLGSCGKTLPGTRTKFDNPDANGEGEICMWGRNVMMGYLNRDDKNEEDFDYEGWFHSGDLGMEDNEGFVFVTGRIKDLLITAGGENVAPLPMEDAIKRELPCLSNVVLIGDKKKFITAFLAFKVKMDKETEQPTSKLSPTSVEWCKSVDSDALTIEDILLKPDAKVLSAIQQGIDRANQTAVSNATKVQKWTILPQDISISGGELGPTLKLKRFFFNQKYFDAIEKLYA